MTTATDLDFQYEAMSSVMRTAARVAVSMLQQHTDELIELALDRFEEAADEYGISIFGGSTDELTTEAKEEAADLLNYISARLLVRIATHTNVYIEGDKDGAEAILHALRSTLEFEQGDDSATYES